MQIWFHTSLTENALPKEPYIAYETFTASDTNTEVDVPAVASIAVIEADAAVAYRANEAAVFADDPVIPVTENTRYVVDCGGVATLNFITAAA